MRNPLLSVRFPTLAALLLLAPAAAVAQPMYIYPQKEQPADQQARDKGECQEWATQQTGFDPLAPPSTSAPTPQPGGPNAVRGAARGAAVGAAVGAIAGDAGKGAGAGAAAGGLGGAMRRRDAERQAEAQHEQQEAQVDAQRAEHRRAMTACLEARGYSVQ